MEHRGTAVRRGRRGRRARPLRRRPDDALGRADRDPAPGIDPLEPRDPALAPAGRDPRENARAASGLCVLAGIWLIVSPWIVGYTSADAWWNPIVFGAIVAVLALVRAAGALRADWISAVNMLIGAWLFASAFWLADSAQASWNVGILGVIVFLLAAWSLASGRERRSPAVPVS